MTDKATPPPARVRPSLRASLESGRGRLLPVRVAAVAAVALLVLLAGAVGDSALRYSLVIGTIYAVAVLGNNAINGTLGEINLAAGASMAVGAYAMAWGLNHDLGLIGSLLLVLLASTAIGVLLAIPTVRLQGIFTALATFALAYAIPDVAIALSEVTGGDAGTAVPPVQVGSVLLDGSSMTMLVVVSAVFVIAGGLTLAGLAGPVGRLLFVVGESPAAARVFGVRVTIVKVAVWTWATVLGAVAGAMYAITVGYLNPTIFVLFLSISLFVAGLVGGARNVAGAWIGGLLVGTLPPNIQSFLPASSSGVVFGGVLLVALLVGSGGLGGLPDRLVTAVAERRGR
ncbi:MAG: branched-chain amino acid ABC transporter permease [Nocardioides sp.]|uniref:branched-chain amino acid ABC transporter permease n=1 Tax=Nocardioides sp. TaxID=35761 RepID=UPI0039E4200E